MSHKFVDKALAAIRKRKVTLTLNEHAYITMCILELSKVLMHEFHYDFIKVNESRHAALFVVSGSTKKIFSIDCVNI